MNVTEIAKQANDTGEDPDWGRVMSQIPKVIKLDLVFESSHVLMVGRGQRWGRTMATNCYLMPNPMTTVGLGHQRKASRSP